MDNLIDTFLEKEVKIEKYGNYDLPALVDFDAYLRRNSFNKSATIGKCITNWLENQ